MLLVLLLIKSGCLRLQSEFLKHSYTVKHLAATGHTGQLYHQGTPERASLAVASRPRRGGPVAFLGLWDVWVSHECRILRVYLGIIN